MNTNTIRIININEYEYEYYLTKIFQQIRIQMLFDKNISTNKNTNTIREWNYSNDSNNTT